MFDLVIRGGRVVDGTGAPPRDADVAVTDGRIVEIAERVDGAAKRTIDADGLIVAPGFVDLHTHYDAQSFWDSTLSPSPLHGVTTVVSGNCGFSIAPLTDRPDDADYLMRMLARVEGMPLHSLQQGVPWDWRTTADYLDRLDHTVVPNIGFLVGHSALRRAVMHEDAVGNQATAEQIEAMRRLLAEGLASGGLGFSSTLAKSHNDHQGSPVPSRHATESEILALCEVVGQHPGTTIEFIPEVMPLQPEHFALMAAMSRTADRPVNWNVLMVNSENADLVAEHLAGSDHAAAGGGCVIALTYPDTPRSRFTFRAGFGLDMLPGWPALMALPPDEKLAMLADPAGRARMEELAQSKGFIRQGNWPNYVILQAFTDETRKFEGRSVGDVAEELGKSPWDTIADIVVQDRLDTIIGHPDRYQDRASWAARVEAWRDPRTVVGASDAGAHLDMIDSYAYTTTLLGTAVRLWSLLPIEEAVHYLTDVPARLYGLKDRGLLTEGYWADIVVFDEATVAPDPPATVFDLPGGASRIVAAAEGIHHVLVAGREVVAGRDFTDERPGRVLRSGRDTDTVTVARAHALQTRGHALATG